MRMLAFLILTVCAISAPAAGQVRETGYFDATGVQGWRMDTDYWLQSGGVRIVPNGTANNGETYCGFEIIRNPFGRAQVEGIFGRVTHQSLINDMRGRGVEVYQTIIVQAYGQGDTYPGYLNNAYPTLLQEYRTGRNGERSAISYLFAGATGLVGLNCYAPYQGALDHSRAIRPVLEGLRITMPPPN